VSATVAREYGANQTGKVRWRVASGEKLSHKAGAGEKGEGRGSIDALNTDATID